MTNVTEITDKTTFLDNTARGRSVVDFARRNGCIPCQRLEPHYRLAAEKMPDITFYKVMLDEIDKDFFEYIISTFGIKSTPTVVEFIDGDVMRHVSARTGPLIIKELSDA